MAVATADTCAVPLLDCDAVPRPLLGSHDCVTAFERSAFGSTTVHTLDCSHQASSTLIALEAVQRLVHGTLGLRPSQSSPAANSFRVQSRLHQSFPEVKWTDQASSHLEAKAKEEGDHHTATASLHFASLFTAFVLIEKSLFLASQQASTVSYARSLNRFLSARTPVYTAALL
jgi:hypothetical protein